MENKRIWSNPITYKGVDTGVSIGEFSTRAAARAAASGQNTQLRENGELDDGK